jgi:hypothetical protein
VPERFHDSSNLPGNPNPLSARLLWIYALAEQSYFIASIQSTDTETIMNHTATPQIQSLKLFDLTGKNVAITGATRGRHISFCFVNFTPTQSMVLPMNNQESASDVQRLFLKQARLYAFLFVHHLHHHNWRKFLRTRKSVLSHAI